MIFTWRMSLTESFKSEFFQINRFLMDSGYLDYTQFFVKMETPIHCIYLFGVLRRFQHCIGHITMGSWKGRGNQYIQFVRVLYCKLPTNGKQLPAFPLEAMPGIEPRPQRWEARVLPLCHCGPPIHCKESLPKIFRNM